MKQFDGERNESEMLQLATLDQVLKMFESRHRVTHLQKLESVDMLGLVESAGDHAQVGGAQLQVEQQVCEVFSSLDNVCQ